MSLQSDHKALIFVGAIAVLGAGVRVVRAANSSPTSGAQPALEHQMQAADSAARAAKMKGRVHTRADTTRRRRGAVRPTSDTAARSVAGPPDRRGYARGYINGRLDLDVATAAQIDSLPGLSPNLAKRIVTDRMRHGPFLALAKLRRVSGVGPALLKQIDSLVVFSGTIAPPSPTDTVIGRGRKPAKGHSKP